jgi:hypothetical protein
MGSVRELLVPAHALFQGALFGPDDSSARSHRIAEFARQRAPRN